MKARKSYPPERCVWCGRMTTDGATESGWTGDGPDPMIDGDFGCDASPESSEDGVGSHVTRTSFAFSARNLDLYGVALRAVVAALTQPVQTPPSDAPTVAILRGDARFAVNIARAALGMNP